MKSKLVKYLSKIYDDLLKLGFSLNEFLNDGNSEKRILDSFADIELVPTSEIINLYTWRNGTNIVEGTKLDDIQFIPGFHLLSLEDAVYQYKLIKNDPLWNKFWFPFMADG